jgi:hypothetical protein
MKNVTVNHDKTPHINDAIMSDTFTTSNFGQRAIITNIKAMTKPIA